MNVSLKPAPVVLVLLAGLTCSLSAQTPAKPAAPAAKKTVGGKGAGGEYRIYSQDTLDNGKKIYTGNCAFCHGGNAKGGESGPDLLRSVIVLHDEDGKDIGAFIHVGRPEKGMPKFNLPDAQVADLAAFLHDSVRAAAQRGTYKILDILVGDPKAGEAYFNGAGRCATCHSVTGDLAHMGSKLDAVDVQQKFVMPRERRGGDSKTAVTVKVTLPDGKVAEGILGHIDDFSVSLTSKDGKEQRFARDGEVPKVELHDPLQAHIDLLAQYTDTDIHNLTAYLVTLK